MGKRRCGGFVCCVVKGLNGQTLKEKDLFNTIVSPLDPMEEYLLAGRSQIETAAAYSEYRAPKDSE